MRFLVLCILTCVCLCLTAFSVIIKPSVLKRIRLLWIPLVKDFVLKEFNNSEATSWCHTTYQKKSVTLTASLDMHIFQFKTQLCLISASSLIPFICAHAKFSRWRKLFFSRFAGNMERQQADNLLKSHSSGTYLIRERTAEAERFAISIKCVFHVIPGGGVGGARGRAQWELLSTSPGESKILTGCHSQRFFSSSHLLPLANHHSVIAFLFLV